MKILLFSNYNHTFLFHSINCADWTMMQKGYQNVNRNPQYVYKCDGDQNLEWFCQIKSAYCYCNKLKEQ